MKNKSIRSFAAYAESSLIIGGLLRLSGFLHRKLGESLIGSAMSSYDDTLSAFRERTAAAGRRFSPVTRGVRRFFMNGAADSLFLRSFRRFSSTAYAMPVRGLAIGTLSAGAYTVLIWLFKRYAVSGSADALDLAVGLSLVAVSLLLFTSRQTVAQMINGSLFAELVLFRLLGLDGVFRAGDGAEEISDDRMRLVYAVSFALGTVFGLASFFVGPVYVLVAAIGLLAMKIVAAAPESGIVMIILALPFAGTMPLVALTSWCFLCWAAKLLCGKRTLRGEPIDLWVLIFTVIYAAGGPVSVFPAESLKHSMVVCDFILIYFMTVNMMRTGEWVKRCAAAICAAGAAVSAYGIYQYVFGLTETTWQDTEMFEDISGRVVSTFGNPNVLGEYLVLMIPLAAALALSAGKTRHKAAWAGCFALGAACLVLTWSRGAWLGFIAAAVLFLLILDHRFASVLLAGVLALPFLPLLLPQNIVNRFASIGNLTDTSTSYRVNIWRGTVNMAKDFLLSGIGTGIKAFQKVYPSYALAGIEGAPHSHHLFLQILIDCGIFGLLAFIILIISFSRSSFGFYRRYAGRGTAQRYLSAAGFCGVIGFLVQGMTDYVWYNYSIVLMFWLMIGLTSAVRRAGISDYPMRAVKKLEDCSPDNAAVDIFLP